MRARHLATATMRAWESKDEIILASLLSDDFSCRGLLPQPVQKAQYLGFMQAIMTAMPDWLFHDHFLDDDFSCSILALCNHPFRKFDTPKDDLPP